MCQDQQVFCLLHPEIANLIIHDVLLHQYSARLVKAAKAHQSATAGTQEIITIACA